MIHLNIDRLYQQLHFIVKTQRFDGRLVLAMGSANNVQILQKYLACYSLKIQAVLDNDPKKRGLWCGECRTFQVEEVLKPFNTKALILVYSPGYGQQMKQQLKNLGYQENTHFYVLEDFRQPKDSWRLFGQAIAMAVKGIRIYKRIMKRYGEDTHLFIVRGATGDVFLNGLYLEAYTKKLQIKKYALVGDAKGLSQIAPLFGIEDTVSLDYEEAECLQRSFQFTHYENVTDLFMWQGSLHFNRCQTRMHREFNFLDTYTHYIYRGLVDRNEWARPAFQPLTQELEEKYRKFGLKKGKTVVVAPYAYSVKRLPSWFWDQIAKRLREKGYAIFVNLNPATEVNPFDYMESLFFPFWECGAVLTYCGYFLALRSGLCDIVSMIPCRQVLLYPEEMNPLDYKVHRSDMAFSGFRAMGFGTDTNVELSSPVIYDVVCAEDFNHSEAELSASYEALINKIEKQFPNLS